MPGQKSSTEYEELWKKHVLGEIGSESNAVYVTSKKKQIKNGPLTAEEEEIEETLWSWTFEGLNWWNGKTEYLIYTGEGLRYNSFFSQTQVGPEKTLLSGAVFGFVKTISSDNNHRSFPE